MSNFREVGAWAGVRRVAVGLAQLATDGRPKHPLPSGGGAARGYARVAIPLREVRVVARTAKVRTDDVALALVAGGLSRAQPGLEVVRSAVPLMMRDPRTAAEGNVTAAVLMDLPVGEQPEPDRLRAVAAISGRLRTPTRAMASRWVMQVTGTVFPVPLHRWFARTVYGRRFFSAIVSTMPGPPHQLWFAGAKIEGAYPLLPLAPGAPVVVGGLGWNGVLCLGVSTDPATVPAELLADGIRATMAELNAWARATGGPLA